MEHEQRSPLGFIQVMNLSRVWFVASIIAIGILTAIGPAEHSLGTHIRIVYLHAAWVWAALAAFLLAGLCGGFGLLTRRSNLHKWSKAFGRTGLVFWLSYLPLSLLAMQSNWNGLFLAEPRWRLALVFSITGILLQVGLSLADKPILSSASNLGYLIALMITLVQTPYVMHPDSPILNSEAWRIQAFFSGLVLVTLFAVVQMARMWYQSESNRLS